jgi:hypothetical protein
MRLHQEPRNLSALRRRGASESPADALEGPVLGASPPARGHAACGITSGGTLGENVDEDQGQSLSPSTEHSPNRGAPPGAGRAQEDSVVDLRAPVLERQRGSGLGFGPAHQLQTWRILSRITRQTSDSFREGGSRRTPCSYGPSRA